MDKRTIVAVVLSVVIIIAWFFVQLIFFPESMGPKQVPGSIAQSRDTGQAVEAEQDHEEQKPDTFIDVEGAEEEEGVARTIPFTTGVFEGAFSTRGANLSSLKLNGFSETDGSKVEMVVSGESGIDPYNLYLDGYNTGSDIFTFSPSVLPNEWEFTRRYVFKRYGTEIPFTLKKKYILKNSEYLMEVRLSLISESREYIPVELYTLAFGPQIGPQYTKLDEQNSYRHFIYYADGKRRDVTRKVKKTRWNIEDRTSWIGIEGKYFVALGISYISDMSNYSAGFDASPLSGLEDHHSIYFERHIRDNSSKIDDGYKFYIGPKKRDILLRYNDSGMNEFEASGLHLENAVPSDFWGWLSAALKWLLEFFYRLIPNWGVAIILVTIVIKILFFPLTHKSFESTHKMQALGPKIEELKQKYKNNTQKMNQEMAALYKREGVNPLGGCLPLLLQLPIFFAMYSLFRNYFELRGAAFIAPWIADLSAPERVLTLPFTIPLVGWSELRILPFLMLAVTFVQQRISQTPGQSNKQSKMLMYAMPAFFFFIMYNMPSGLLLYWTMQNLFTFITQFYINHIKGKKDNGTGEKNDSRIRR